MLTNNDQKHWGPIPEIAASLSALIPEGARVLEIGPGNVPFFRSTHFIDHVPGENVYICDIQYERFPFEDNYFDFIYSRHVAEDLFTFKNFLEEMSRVGKAGYIETPSPAAEICRGVDGNSPKWRGYHHHNFVVYEDEDATLCFLRKYPAIEHTDFENEEFFENALRLSPFLWNTYYLWQDEIKWKLLDNDIAFGGYGKRLFDAARTSIDSTNRTIQRLAKASEGKSK